MKISIVLLFFAVSVTNADFFYSPSFNSAFVKSEQVGGNFAYSVVESSGYVPVNPVIQNVFRFPQGIIQYPFGPPQILYPGQPIFGFPGLYPQGPGVSPISPPFISAPRPPPPSESPSQVIVDEDTVAIDSA